MVVEHVMIERPYAKVDGVLRRGGEQPSETVVLQTHPRRDSFLNAAAWPMRALPAEGVDTFAFNNRFSNSAAGIDVATLWEPLVLDVGAAVGEMRARGYANVVLYGTSAGGPLVAFYQAVAERGNAIFGGEPTLSGYPGFFAEGGDELQLPPADALVLQNATSGPATSFCLRLDGAIVDEAEAIRDPALDMFDPANGFDPETGQASYGRDFLRGYYEAQAARMNRLIDVAQERLARMRRLGRPFVDDAFMVIPGVRACPAFVDLGVAHESRGRWTSWPSGIEGTITSDRRPVPGAARANISRAGGTTAHTLTSFLSYRAVACDLDRYEPFAPRAADVGMVAGSTNAALARTLPAVAAPLLVTQGTADIEVHIPTAELIFDSATMSDKELSFIEGADHGMLAAEGDPDRTRAVHLARVGDWLATRFGAVGTTRTSAGFSRAPRG